METDPRNLQQLEAAIQSAFAPFDRTFPGQAAWALAGEYFGRATFAAFVRQAEDADERRFWAVSTSLEALMVKRLEDLLERERIAKPDRAPYEAIGEWTAAVLSGDNRVAYCKWVAPLIEEALAAFRNLEVHGEGRQDRFVLGQLVTHELAFSSAWALLPSGYGAAASPLVTCLEALR